VKPNQEIDITRVYEALREAYPVASLTQLSASAHRPPSILRLADSVALGVAKILETMRAADASSPNECLKG